MDTGEENQTSYIKKEGEGKEEKVTVSKAKSKKMQANKLFSKAETTFDEMTSINIKYELKMTTKGMGFENVEAKNVIAKKINVAKGKLIAKSLTAKEMKMAKMSGSIEIAISQLKKAEFAAEEYVTEPGGF